MRTRLSLALVTTCALGCSGSTPRPDAGPIDAGDPQETLGLQLSSCYEFSTNPALAASPPDLGVAVEANNAKAIRYLTDGGSASVDSLKVVYRRLGIPVMTDNLVIDGRNVLLLKRSVQGAELTEYKPAVTLLQLPFKAAQHLDFNGSIRETVGSSTTPDEDYGFSFDVLADAFREVGSAEDGGAGFSVTYVESPGHRRLEKWGFDAKGGGLYEVAGAMVALPDGGVSSSTYYRQSFRTLANASDICGSGH
jgi:hypothetical protein